MARFFLMYLRSLTFIPTPTPTLNPPQVADRSALMKFESFDPPTQLVAAVYAAITASDRAYLCSLIAAAALASYWSTTMRRKVDIRFHLQALHPSDIQYKGRMSVIPAHVIAAATAAAATVQIKDTARVDAANARSGDGDENEGEEEEEEVEEEEEEEAVLPDIAAPMGRRTAIMRADKGQRDGAEAAVEDRLYCGQLACTGVLDNEGEWMWSAPLMIERLPLAARMMQQFGAAWCGRDFSWLDSIYPSVRDSFQDTVDDELVGVGFIYLDPLQYLLDVDDLIPITDMAGHAAGAVKVRCRSWIDKIEVSPPYLSVDRERTLEEFGSKTLITRLYFEGMQDLPSNLCAATYISFKFFYHSKPYKTPRHAGATTHPHLNSTVSVDQKITPDFIEFCRRGSIEVEVYGKRRMALQAPAPGDVPLRVGEYVPPYVPPAAAEGQDDDEQAEQGDSVEAVKAELDEVTAELQGVERQLFRSNKMTEAVQEEKFRLEVETGRLSARVAEQEKEKMRLVGQLQDSRNELEALMLQKKKRSSVCSVM